MAESHTCSYLGTEKNSVVNLYRNKYSSFAFADNYLLDWLQLKEDFLVVKISTQSVKCMTTLVDISCLHGLREAKTPYDSIDRTSLLSDIVN